VIFVSLTQSLTFFFTGDVATNGVVQKELRYSMSSSGHRKVGPSSLEYVQHRQSQITEGASK
jgi:hypothetical protein